MNIKLPNPAIVTMIDLEIFDVESVGALSGKECVVKDNIDIAGFTTGGGNPTWAATHSPAVQHAPCILPLLNAGARITAKTQLDELAFSLMGINHHYGTPLNPFNVDRVPGGSSSGSANAVASGFADIGVGTDTGGSVRLPASFCGLYGLRPTHDSINMKGVIPLGSSYDTIGFFTRNLREMINIAQLYFAEPAKQIEGKLTAPLDVWHISDEATRTALWQHFSLSEHVKKRDVLLDPGDLTDWSEVFRVHQSYEVWQALGPWITANMPDFGPGLKERFEFASTVTKESFHEAQYKRQRFVAYLDSLVGFNEILVIPTSPGPAPFLNSSPKDLNAFRMKAIALLCIAGHAGWPQLTIPGATVADAQIGLSLIGKPGSEFVLLNQAKRLTDGTQG